MGRDFFGGSPVEDVEGSVGNMFCALSAEQEIPFIAMATPCTYVVMASTKSLSRTAILSQSKSKTSFPFSLSHVMILCQEQDMTGTDLSVP